MAGTDLVWGSGGVTREEGNGWIGLEKLRRGGILGMGISTSNSINLGWGEVERGEL